MPILGIMASAMSANFWQPQGAYDALSTVTVPAGGVASITFAGIPNTYKHLQIRGLAQSNRATYGFDDIKLRFNSDSGTNYARHYLGGDGSSAYSGAASTPSTFLFIDSGAGTSTAGASFFGASIIDILDYTSTSKNKTLRALCGADVNGTVGGLGGRVTFNSGLWFATPVAINSITITPDASTFSQNTQFSLYGVR
jgi:hypothetical protein